MKERDRAKSVKERASESVQEKMQERARAQESECASECVWARERVRAYERRAERHKRESADAERDNTLTTTVDHIDFMETDSVNYFFTLL